MTRSHANEQQSDLIEPEAALAAVENICASGIFDYDLRSIELLRFMIAEELAGRGEMISALHISHIVLGKEEKSDPTSDSEVRLAILQLRNGLEKYYELLGKDDELKIILKPATLRLEIARREQDEWLQPKAASRYFNWRSPKLRWLAVALALIFTASTAAAMIFFPHLLQNRSDECASARPFVAISFTDTRGFKPEKLKEWELALRRYIDYYPRITQEPGNAASCPGTPSYSLEITNPADPTAPVLASLNTGDGEFIWSRPYAKSDFIGKDSENLGLAKIAYEIGYGQGVVAIDASNRPWQNQRASGQYKCVNRAHEFFMNSEVDQFDAAVECLKKYTKDDHAAADTYALNAALLLELVIYDKPGGSKELIKEINRLIMAGRSKETANSELLMVEMRVARYDLYPASQAFATTATAAGIIERYFRMEPHILNQLALAYARQGRFAEALRYSDRAQAIMGHFSSTYLAPTIAHIGLGQWTEAAINKQKLRAMNYSLGPLMLLAIAHETDDRDNINFAFKQLQSHGLKSRQRILDEITGLSQDDRFKQQLTNSIRNLFDNLH